MSLKHTRDHYETVYSNIDYFGQESKIYKFFIQALVRKVGISRDSKVLDFGCGQGCLSYYLSCCEMNVFCADLSLKGLQSFDRYEQRFESKRVVADIMHAPFNSYFDMVFTRSCSLHNDYFKNRQDQDRFIDEMVKCLKPDGIICLIYNSNLTGKGQVWFNCTYRDFKDSIPSSKLYDVNFYTVNKFDTLIFGKHSFNKIFTCLNRAASRVLKKNIELIAIGRKIPD